MRHALVLAGRGIGMATPNPSVGCVIVKDGQIVGRGWTQPGGRPHAEYAALEMAGALARGATCYTTLEPCAHSSVRGPACSDRLIAAGVSRVVMAMIDPDIRTAGEGKARLEAVGVSVTLGVCEAEARHQLRAFRLRLALQRPWVTLKLAVTLDGFIAQPDGVSQWITGPDSRAHAHLVRARQDAIIVGSGTAARDHPQLTVRLPGLEDRRPQPIILSARNFAHAIEGARVVAAPDLPRFLTGLGAEGMLQVLVEGGARTAAAFLQADVVDEIHLYRAPVLLGQGRHMSDSLAGQDLATAHGVWAIRETRRLGPDDWTMYLRNREN